MIINRQKSAALYGQLLCLAALLYYVPLSAQVAIGSSTPAPSALLELKSGSQGFLPPRMNTQQRDAIASPAQGLVIFNTEEQSLNFFNGDFWESTRSGVIFDPCANNLPLLFGGAATVLPTSIATDAAGNFIVAGPFVGPLTLGSTIIPNQGGFDIFIFKMNAAGEIIWQFTAGTAGFESIRSIKALKNGDLIICGNLSGTLNFLNSSFEDANGGNEFYVARISTDGQVIWKSYFGLQGSGEILDMDVYENDNIVVGGRFSGSINPQGNNLLSNSKMEPFWAGFNALGECKYTRTSTAATQAANTIERIAAKGNKIYVSGTISGTLTIGPITLTTTTNSVWMGRLDTLGNILWALKAENQTQSFVGPLAVHPGGDLFASVSYQGVNFVFGNINVPNASLQDYVVARIDTTGNIKWLNKFGGQGSESLGGMISDENGRLFGIGRNSNALTLGTFTLPTPGLFLTELDAGNGSTQWVSGMSSPGGNVFGQAILSLPRNQLALLGRGGSATKFGDAACNERTPTSTSTGIIMKADKNGRLY